VRQERRILFEAAIVSVLGHTIFFSVFTVKETAPGTAPAPSLPAVVQLAHLQPPEPDPSRATPNPAAADPDRLAYVELQRRTAAPKLELDRTTFVWEDEPELAAPAQPAVGPATWRFAKEAALLAAPFPADYDAAPSLALARNTILGIGPGADRPPTIPFTIAFRKLPGAGALVVRPGEAMGEDVRFVRGEIQINDADGSVQVTLRSSGDPRIDAMVLRHVSRWEFNIGRTGEGFQLRGRLRLPISVRARRPARTPPSADDVFDEPPPTSEDES